MRLTKLLSALIELGQCSLMPTGAGRMLRRGGAPKPTLDLDFTRGTMPAGLTFSRSSNATRVGPTGLLEWAPHNSIINSEFVGATVGSPGSPGTGWAAFATVNGVTREVVGTGAINGSQYIDVRFSGTATANGAAHGIAPAVNIAALPGQTWTYEIDVALIAGSWQGNSLFSLEAVERNSGGSLLASTTVDLRTIVTGPTLLRCSVTRQFNQATTAFFDALVRLNGITGTTYDFTVRVSRPHARMLPCTTGYLPTTGSAYYGPRFDYDPTTLACRGLLIEDQRVNYVANSDLVDDSSTAGNVTITKNAQGCDGVANAASTVATTTSSSSHFCRSLGGSGLTTVVGTTYVMSAVLKAGTTNRIQLTGTGGIFGSTLYGNFLLTGAGSVLATGGLVASGIRLLANGFYHCWIAANATAASSISAASAVIVVHINSDTAARIPVYVGSGESVIVHHTQLEVGALPTSIVPTYGASATRAADSLTSTLGSWYSASGGTLIAEGDNSISAAGSGSICEVGFDDGTGNNRIYLRSLTTSGNTQGTIVSGGSVLENQNAGNNIAFGVAKKSAISFTAGRQATAQDGAIATRAAVALPTSINRLTIGQGASSFAKNGRMRRVTYYPVALPEAALQALTR